MRLGACLAMLLSSTLQLSQGLSPFVAGLQGAVARNDRAAVAGMMRYPLQVTASGLQIPVENAAAFTDLYDTIMSPAMKQVIARARVPAPGTKVPGVIVATDGGISFESAVAIARVGDGFKVVRLAVPVGAAAKGTAAESPERRLTFRATQPTQVSGTLTPGGRDRYAFHAIRGALIDVRLSGVPGRTVLLRVTDAGGKAVDARADAGTRVWTGRVGEDGTYRIEVVRQPNTGTEPLIYTMAVSVK